MKHLSGSGRCSGRRGRLTVTNVRTNHIDACTQIAVGVPNPAVVHGDVDSMIWPLPFGIQINLGLSMLAHPISWINNTKE